MPLPRLTLRPIQGGCLIGGVIVGVLAGVWLVRAVGDAREAARRSQCSGNLNWIVVHLHDYHSVHGSFPAGTIPNPGLPPEHRLGWIVAYWSVQCVGTKPRVDLTKGWDEPPNWPIQFVTDPNITYVGMTAEDTANFVRCPDDPSALQNRKSFPLCYVGIAGLGSDAPTLPPKHPRAGVFGFDRATRLTDVTDGTSQTAILVETSRDNGPWSAGGTTSVRGVDPGTRPYFGRNRPFGGYHPGGANAAFADGSVRFLRDTVDPKVFEALSTIAGGESLPNGWDR